MTKNNSKADGTSETWRQNPMPCVQIMRWIDDVEDAVKKSLKYSRTAKFMYKLEIASLASAALMVIIYVLTYGAYWQFAAMGAVGGFATYEADRLYRRYYRKALEEADRLDKLICMAATSIGLDQAKTDEEAGNNASVS